MRCLRCRPGGSKAGQAFHQGEPALLLRTLWERTVLGRHGEARPLGCACSVLLPCLCCLFMQVKEDGSSLMQWLELHHPGQAKRTPRR